MRSRALGLVVPRERAESVRTRLAAAGLLAPDLAPRRTEDGDVCFPLASDASASPTQPEATDEALHRLLRSAGLEDELGAGIHLTTTTFDERPPRVRNYRERLSMLPAEVQRALPVGFDVIGAIAVMKLPETVRPHAAAVADAVLATHGNIRTVALDRGVTGTLRVRDLEVIGGEPDLRTIHREHGLEIEVPLDRTYFSPRLATERQRVAARVAPGQHVLDLFAGVGAFVCLVARDQAPGEVLAVDLNEDAIHALQRNLERNRIDGARVGTREADARSLSHDPDLHRRFHHVIMNLPHDASAFLDVAAWTVRDDGEVHLYAMVERGQEAVLAAAAVGVLDQAVSSQSVERPTGWRLLETRHVRNYAPTMDGLAFTFGGPEHPHVARRHGRSDAETMLK